MALRRWHPCAAAALFSGPAVKLYEADGATFKLRTTLKGHTKQGMGLSFSPDGKLLASSGKDAKCVVWEVAGGQPLLTKIFAGDVEDVAFAATFVGAATVVAAGITTLTQPLFAYEVAL